MEHNYIRFMSLLRGTKSYQHFYSCRTCFKFSKTQFTLEFEGLSDPGSLHEYKQLWSPPWCAMG